MLCKHSDHSTTASKSIQTHTDLTVIFHMVTDCRSTVCTILAKSSLLRTGLPTNMVLFIEVVGFVLAVAGMFQGMYSPQHLTHRGTTL